MPVSSVASKHYRELEGEKVGSVWGTVLPSILSRWVFIYLSPSDASIGVVHLLVNVRFKLLTFCFKVFVRRSGRGHWFCYLKGIMKSKIEGNFKQNQSKSEHLISQMTDFVKNYCTVTWSLSRQETVKTYRKSNSKG